MNRAALILPLAVTLSGCARPAPACAGRAVRPGDALTCATPGYADRGFDLEVPAGWDGRAPLPVVVSLHGAGGSRINAASNTCPSGAVGEPGCFSAVALGKGMAVVRPDGSGTRSWRRAMRTWNAGGGGAGFSCTSGSACKEGVDDVRFFATLLDEIARIIPVDARRVYAAGISNGAAMSHRLACELPGRFAAIAAVAGGNQHALVGGACAPGVAILQIHGTDDPCWGFAQGNRSCLEGAAAGIKAGVPQTMEGWRARNGCALEPVEVPLPDRAPGDGTRVHQVRWTGCVADVELLRIEGGGHTWPNGHQYLGAAAVGRVTRDIGSERIVDFLLAHARR